MKKFVFPLLICLTTTVTATNPQFEQRKTDFIDSALTHFNGNAIIFQAFRDSVVDQATLDTLLARIPTRTVADFDIVRLIRVLFLSNGEYDAQILPVLNQLPFWLNKGDITRGYWSENHMCMWMSSNWLLHEKYGNVIDENLDYRLRHYLRLKIKYGFYEYFSGNYYPFTFCGLSNLADFAQDQEIKNLATKAAQRLLKDIMVVTTDLGVYSPTTSRGFYDLYDTAYGHNHSNLTYLLTGFGPHPAELSHSGPFLATTTIDLDDVIDSWKPHIDSSFTIGHSIDSGFVINDSLTDTDRILFQWSSGTYFPPQTAQETAQLLHDSDLWDHVDFTRLKPLSFNPIEDFPQIAEDLSVASKSSVYAGQDLVVFKNNSISLCSTQNYWKGKLGYQQFPCVANLGTTAVIPSSGPATSDWDSRPRNNAHEHLPYVSQTKNVALVMYRPEEKPNWLGYLNPETSLFWNENDYDEIVLDSLWLIGKHNESYVAVKRACTDTINGVLGCEMTYGDAQSWAIVIGDSSMYGNFENFKNVIQQASHEEVWYYDTLNGESVFYAKIIVDGITIDHAWGVKEPLVGLEETNPLNNEFLLFPNPTKELVRVNLSNANLEYSTITVVNLLGEVIFQKKLNNHSTTINTAFWEKGIYLVTADTNKGRITKKLIKQ